jgi:peroxiredoxin
MAESTKPAAATRARPGARRIALAIGLALGIVGVAWGITGRSDLGSLGQGGVNQKLLPKVGDPAPDFVALDLLGNEVRLSDFKGQPVWLNFWGSWCPPCRAEMPDIEQAYSVLGPQGVVLLAVSLDESTVEAALFAARNEATFTILSDPNRAGTGATYPIYNFPTHVFIDRDGIVRMIVLAPMGVEQAVQIGTELVTGGL